MYLKPDVCAHCGKKIDLVSVKYAPHNTELEWLFPSPMDEVRPYYCCPAHVDAAFAEYYPDNYGASTDHQEKEIAEKWHRRWGNEVNPDCRPHNQQPRGDAFKSIIFNMRLGDNELDWTTNNAMLKEMAAVRRGQERYDQKARNYAHKQLPKDYYHARLRSDADYQAIADQEAEQVQRELAAEEEKNRPVSFAEYHPTFEQLTEHCHIFGPSGSGKTQLLQEMFLHFIGQPNPPAMIFLDPKGLATERIAQLSIFNPINGIYNDRIIIIDLNDPVPAALNLFRPTSNPHFIHRAIDTFDYIFAQAGSALTPKMRPVFKFCARLMFSIPNPSINLIMDLLESKEGDPRFKPYIDTLTDEGAIRFFRSDFYSKGLAETRELTKNRFNEIQSMPEIKKIFDSTAPTFDFYKAIQERKIILVNTGASVAFDQSQLLGRYIINQCLNAAYARGRLLPQSHWTPALLFIDEFQDYVDELSTPRQLRMAREYKLGMICAHQEIYCAELTDPVRSAISTNTTVKYCAKPGGMNLGYMVRDFDGNEEFLLRQTWIKNVQGKFGCYIRGTDQFVSILIKFGNINPSMHMSDHHYQQLLEENRQQFLPPTNVIPLPTVDRTFHHDLIIDPAVAKAGGMLDFTIQLGEHSREYAMEFPPDTPPGIFHIPNIERPDRLLGDLYLTIAIAHPKPILVQDDPPPPQTPPKPGTYKGKAKRKPEK